MLSNEMASLLKQWIKHEKTFKRDVETEIIQYISNRNVLFLYGPRRAGKSVVVKRILWHEKKKSKVRYVNLEDPGFTAELNVSLMDKLAEGIGSEDLLIFDEIQIIEGWEKWVRRAVDNRQCKLIITGSSAKLLSSEFATTLGGRGIGFQILPLSFREFNRVTKNSLEKYLDLGGYPEIVLNPEKKEKLLESYFELALIRDIVARYNVRDVPALRNLALYLLTNSGKETSLKQIRIALGLSYDTIRQFIAYLGSSFLIMQVPFFSYSLKESLTMPRKIYAWDMGMQSYASKSFSQDMGRKIEGIVAIELRRRGYEIYYWRGKKEVDFIARKKNEIIPMNVCYHKLLPEREFEGLIDFCQKFKLQNPKLLYLGKTIQIEKRGVNIKLVNIKDWLLKDN